MNVWLVTYAYKDHQSGKQLVEAETALKALKKFAADWERLYAENEYDIVNPDELKDIHVALWLTGSADNVILR
jgi:hypothetical protein